MMHHYIILYAPKVAQLIVEMKNRKIIEIF